MQIEKLIEQYSLSIKAIFNILAIESNADVPVLEKFNFHNIDYPFCINQCIYDRWVHRHAFIDILELTRECLFVYIKKFGIEESKNLKNLHIFNVCKLLEKFNLKNECKDFYDIYNDYNNVRNCLTHRLGFISDIDKTPITMTYPSLHYCMLHKGVINKFNTLENMIDGTKNLTGNREIIINLSLKTNIYQNCDYIIIDSETIFGISLYLYLKLPELLSKISTEYKDEINNFFKIYSPFKNKLKTTYKLDNEIVINEYPLEYILP